jgi:hypothetical protein
LGANVPSQLSAAVVEVPGGYRVDDASGKRLGYFYFDATATYRADALTEDEARRMAEDFAKLRIYSRRSSYRRRAMAPSVREFMLASAISRFVRRMPAVSSAS